jgi:hypothetical protein
LQGLELHWGEYSIPGLRASGFGLRASRLRD